MKAFCEKSSARHTDKLKSGAEVFSRRQLLLETARTEAQQSMRQGCSHKDYAQWQELLLAVETAIRVIQAEELS
jgi:type III secretion system YseE family protein